MTAAGVNQIRPRKSQFPQNLIDGIFHHHLQIERTTAQHPHGALRFDAVNKFLNPRKIPGYEKKLLLFPMIFAVGIAEIFVIRNPVILHVPKKGSGDGGRDFYMVIEGNIANFISGRTGWHVGQCIFQDPKKLIGLHIFRRTKCKIFPKILLDAGINAATCRRRVASHRIIHRLRRIELFHGII